MLTPKLGAATKSAVLLDALATQTRTSGGSSETDVKELAVNPRRVPSGATVDTMVTPVMKRPIALRNSNTLTWSGLVIHCLCMAARRLDGGKIGRASCRERV